MMKPATEEVRTGANWPPEEGEVISFQSSNGWKTGILQEVRWGLVWRDFILEDGRVIPERKISGCPQPPVWRKATEVTEDERELWEGRLASMAEAGLDPRDREQAFWAELNQYLAYTYLRFKPGGPSPPEGDRRSGLVEITLDEFPERIKDVKHVVMGRLSELLESKTGVQERESAAFSLGTLKNLEAALQTRLPT